VCIPSSNLCRAITLLVHLPSGFTFIWHSTPMIKKILVALDLDSDTDIATQYAIQIAKQSDAKLTGLAVVDTKKIELSSRGGGIGSFYFAEKLRENLTAETRDKARGLIKVFEEKVDKHDVNHVELVEEGVPFERIVEDMKYHDLLIVGNDAHFFYGHPKEHTETLSGIFKRSIGPSLVVAKQFRTVKKVLFATDGNNPAARAIRRFIHMAPFGTDIEIHVLHVHKKEDADAELILQMNRAYLNEHGYNPQMIKMIDTNPGKCVIDQSISLDVDLIVCGGTAHTGIRGTRFGQSTSYMVEHTTVPLFMDH